MMFKTRGKGGAYQRLEEERYLQLKGVNQPEGEVHQDEQTHCLSARMRNLAFPKNYGNSF